MGIYPSFKEIPNRVLEQLLAAPFDTAANDALLFVVEEQTAGWSAITTTSQLTDDELAARFASAVIPVEPEARRVLGHLDLGKYPDDDASFACFLRIASLDLEPDFSAAFEDPTLWETIAEPWPTLQTCVTGQVNGTDQLGFYSDVPCYGINGYRTPDELARLWELAARGLARSRFRERLVTQFREALAYYEGCARRGSADLYVVW